MNERYLHIPVPSAIVRRIITLKETFEKREGLYNARICIRATDMAERQFRGCLLRPQDNKCHAGFRVYREVRAGVPYGIRHV